MKKILIGFAATAAMVGAWALLATRDNTATHAVLQASELPPLIPTRAFYADPNSASAYVVSADGKYISYEQTSLTGTEIVVKEVATNEVISEFPEQLQFRRWHPTKPLLRFIYEGNDWEADPLKPGRENWRRTSPVRLSAGWFKGSASQSFPS